MAKQQKITIDGVVFPPESQDAADRYFSVWTAQRDALTNFDSSPEALRDALFSIALLSEAAEIAVMSDDEIRRIPPVAITRTTKLAYLGSKYDRYAPGDIYVEIVGDPTAHRIFDLCSNARDVLTALDELCNFRRAQGALSGLDFEEARKEALEQSRAFARVFWVWYSDQYHTRLPLERDPVLDRRNVPQLTIVDARGMAQAFSSAYDGKGWEEIIGEFALQFKGDLFAILLDGNRFLEWWGDSKDSKSLLKELQKYGPHSEKMFLFVISLIFATSPVLDIETDDLLDFIGIEPHGTEDRQLKRLHMYRTLQIISAATFLPKRKKRYYDRSQRRHIEIESNDPLFTVAPWNETGRQPISFNIETAPPQLSIIPSPLLAQMRANRRLSIVFGDIVKLARSPKGKPSSSWGTTLSFALQQLWNDDARKGDAASRAAGRFSRALSRREIFDLFRPYPSLEGVFRDNPNRAVAYWDGAIKYAKKCGVLADYHGWNGTPLLDWSPKARAARGKREGWTDAFLDEALDFVLCRNATDALE